MPEPLSAQISSRDLLSFTSSRRPFAPFSTFYELYESHRFLFMYLLPPLSLKHLGPPRILGSRRAELSHQSLVFFYSPPCVTIHKYAVSAPPTRVRAGGPPSLTSLA